ncbi:GNAT family N-acetyltransferase [Actinacidiphila acidipaludis]|uniref:GNAT family N-acetyltransferase n=1 Tax=Actinacidiphila acidipaludis TaxID=2873382 RepID=A0ABS7QHB7_9ACTN|nr:GNAT family N-acetyltransferase [Streptomyces acidipaludis]MBY8882566.1 GNAT family N-acetyltransferase [Streptomyces acidipaludis]
MSPDHPTIRPARSTDDAALVALDRAGWSWLSEVAPRRAADSAMFGDTCPADDFLVAELGGRVVGYVRQVPPTPLVSNRHVRQIRGLQVSTDARGHGVGRALVEAACAAALAEGARRMTLRVLGHNAPARRLYERCGFRVEGVLPDEFLLNGAYVDDVLMGRPLPD